MYKQLAKLRNKNTAQRKNGQETCKGILTANKHTEQWPHRQAPEMQTCPLETLEPPGKAQPTPPARAGPADQPWEPGGTPTARPRE